jgi:uncharacterized protein
MTIIKLKHKQALLALGLTALGLVTWAFVIEPDRLFVKESRLPLPNWPKPLSGLRIAALADLHIGAPHMDLGKLPQIVALTNAQEPDLILLLGDYVIQFRVWWPVRRTDRHRARTGETQSQGRHFRGFGKSRSMV